ncbi:MAG: sulfate ABC transporter permease subunit CysT, partial [Proteobacteria bacterium]|nr:sulfate ABC transporter permease subunit CysT [Pseudomonadota bacterium]
MTIAASPRRPRFLEPSALGGFWPALGFTLCYLSFFVLLPLAALALRPWELGVSGVWRVLSAPRTVAALELSFGSAFIAACVNIVFGTIAAWSLVRYDFAGRRLLDALVDLPFALPTAVAGIALTAIYAPNGIVGELLTPLGIRVAYTPIGVVIALIFVGFPFVVRTIQPVLEDLDPEVEEAAATLGATRWRTLTHVVFP